MLHSPLIIYFNQFQTWAIKTEHELSHFYTQSSNRLIHYMIVGISIHCRRNIRSWRSEVDKSGFSGNSRKLIFLDQGITILDIERPEFLCLDLSKITLLCWPNDFQWKFMFLKKFFAAQNEAEITLIMRKKMLDCQKFSKKWT